MNNLKAKRIEKGMTQDEVAKACGITQCAYSYYEIGKRQPKPAMLRKLASIFECTIDDLIGDDDDGTGAERA